MTLAIVTPFRHYSPMRTPKIRRTKARPNAELKRFREEKGLTQAQLAHLVGCSQSDIGGLETGARRTTADWSVRLAPHLGVLPQQLFPSSIGTESPQPPPMAGPLDPEKLRHARAIARRLVADYSDGNPDRREEAIAQLQAAVYDVLAEREASGRRIVDSEEGLALIESTLRRIWRPPTQ